MSRKKSDESQCLLRLFILKADPKLISNQLQLQQCYLWSIKLTDNNDKTLK